MRAFAWILVGLGIVAGLAGVVLLVIGDTRTVSEIAYDALLRREPTSVAWPMVIVGGGLAAFGVLLLAIRAPARA